MTRVPAPAWALALLLLAPATARAAEPVRLGVELLGGAALNLRTPLEVRQDGFETLRFHAAYRTRPFEQPLYWALRLTRERGTDGWSLELLHHKLYLDDPPPEIREFSISHGFNLVTLQRAWAVSGYRVRGGLGAVVAHPESEVRGRKLDEHLGMLRAGYYVSGAAVIAGAERRVALGRGAVLVVEARGSAASVSVPIADGRASLTNLALHLLAGVGWFR